MFKVGVLGDDPDPEEAVSIGGEEDCGDGDGDGEAFGVEGIAVLVVEVVDVAVSPEARSEVASWGGIVAFGINSEGTGCSVSRV